MSANLHPEILTDKQKGVLDKLDFLSQRSLYLAGGTALAIQLGHRTSLDFDYYSPQRFDNYELVNSFRQTFSDVEAQTAQPQDTLHLIVSGVSVSAFYYPYRLISNPVDYHSTKLASLQDIAAMKIAAIIQRAKQRDFIDIYFLIQKLGLDEIVRSTYQKYPWYEENNQVIFRSLTYFTEADSDNESERTTLTDQSLTWDKVKQIIKREVDKYSESL